MWSVLKKRISRLHALLTRSINGLVGHLLRSRWPEIALLGVVSIAYGFGVLNPDPTLVLPGREIQAHVGFMELFNHWLRGETSFPLWNPIPGHGRSLIADPFLFVFNPFMSVPVAALGVVSGPKVAVLLHLFIAGLGCWAIARVLDLGRPARLWCGLLYMMSGAFPAYLSAGQFQLALSLSWLPWSIAGLLWALRDPGAISVACAAAAQALFFFSGNLYHQFYGGITLLLIGLACIIDWQRRKLGMRRLRSFAGVALLSLGLIAVQLLPMATSISSMHNEGGYQREDRNFPGSQRPEHAILNYLVSDPWFYLDPTLDKIPYLQESYRFIGIAPFLLLLFLVPAYRQGHRREIAAFAASFAILVGWASLRYSPVRYLYDAAPFLYQLRFPGRALSVGALSLILLAGFGLNYLWGSTDQLRQSVQGHDLAGRSTAVLIAKALVVAGIVGGIYRAFEFNRELFFFGTDPATGGRSRRGVTARARP